KSVEDWNGFVRLTCLCRKQPCLNVSRPYLICLNESFRERTAAIFSPAFICFVREFRPRSLGQCMGGGIQNRTEGRSEGQLLPSDSSHSSGELPGMSSASQIQGRLCHDRFQTIAVGR